MLQCTAALLQLEPFLYLLMQKFFFCGHDLFDDNFKFSYYLRGICQLMNGGDSISLQYCKITVHNHYVPQFNLFQIQTMAY